MEIKDIPGAKLRTFKKGDILIYNGEYIECVYYIQKGIVGARMIAENGNEHIYNLMYGGNGANSLVGVGMLFDNNGISTFEQIAVSDCQCFEISRENIIQYLNEHTDEWQVLFKRLMHVCVDIRNQLVSRQGYSMVQGLCFFLLDNVSEKNGELIVDKKHTNVEIAKFLGIHPKSVSRMLVELGKQSSVIRTKNGLKILDLQQIKDISEGISRLEYRKGKI